MASYSYVLCILRLNVCVGTTTPLTHPDFLSHFSVGSKNTEPILRHILSYQIGMRALLHITVRAYRVWIGEIIDYPLFDVISCAPKGTDLFLIAPFHFGWVVETMVEVVFCPR